MYMRAFAEAWPDAEIVQQAVGQLPWGRDKAQPIGVAEYQLVESLPPELQTSLPSIEQIERELAGGDASQGDGAE